MAEKGIASLSELAREIGLSRATISSLSNGKGNPSLSTIQAIAAHLEKPVSYFLSEPHFKVDKNEVVA